MEVEVNYLAVIVAAVVNMGIGSLWYSKVLFGKPWRAMMGITEEKMKARNPMKAMLGATLAGLLMAYVLAHIVEYANSTTVEGGLQAGFWVWLGFIATYGLNSVLFEQKPWKLYAINVGNYFVSLLLMGVIISVWR